MRGYPPDTTRRAHVRESLSDLPGLWASGGHEPPAPLAMFIRIVVLLVIAFCVGLACFGLAGQLLVSMPH
jgi:hypothetical protein